MGIGYISKIKLSILNPTHPHKFFERKRHKSVPKVSVPCYGKHLSFFLGEIITFSKLNYFLGTESCMNYIEIGCIHIAPVISGTS